MYWWITNVSFVSPWTGVQVFRLRCAGTWLGQTSCEVVHRDNVECFTLLRKQQRWSMPTMLIDYWCAHVDSSRMSCLADPFSNPLLWLRILWVTSCMNWSCCSYKTHVFATSKCALYHMHHVKVTTLTWEHSFPLFYHFNKCTPNELPSSTTSTCGTPNCPLLPPQHLVLQTHAKLPSCATSTFGSPSARLTVKLRRNCKLFREHQTSGNRSSRGKCRDWNLEAGTMNGGLLSPLSELLQ